MTSVGVMVKSLTDFTGSNDEKPIIDFTGSNGKSPNGLIWSKGEKCK